MANFADAGQQYDGSLIPAKTIVKGVLRIKAFNADQGMIVTQSKSDPNNFYLDTTVEITEGKHAGRKVFNNLIGVAGSEKFVNNGRAAIKAILEFNGASPSNMAGYNLPQHGDDPVHSVDWLALDGAPVAAVVKVETGSIKDEQTKERYPDKNKIAAFLTPLDPSLKKDWERFVSGNWEVAETATKPAQTSMQPSWGGQQPAGTPPQGSPAWGGGTPQQQTTQQQRPASAPQQQPLSRPSWAGAGPQQGGSQVDDTPPFN